MDVEQPVSVESIVESVKITSEPYPACHPECRLYTISWTEPEGSREQKTHALCPRFWCGPFKHAPEQVLIERSPFVIETAWLPIPRHDRASVATVYLLAFYEPSGLSRVEGRIGICSQWRDPQAGNIDPDGKWIDLIERYWAAEGPGVYPITIEEIPEQGWIDIGRMDEPGIKLKRHYGDPSRAISEIYGDELDKVMEAWKAAQ